MRRVVGPLLVGLGVFLLALAVLLPSVVVPRVEKAPLDAYARNDAVGTADYLNTQKLTAREANPFETGDQVIVRRIARGDVKAGDGDVASYDYSQAILPSRMDQPLDVITERIRLDRKTGYGVGGGDDRPDHKGALTVKFPFDVQKRTYQLWEPTASKSFPVSFVKETTVRGLDVYEFSGPIPETRRDSSSVPGALVGQPGVGSVFVDQLYENAERAVYVEPRTGIVVDASSKPRRFLRPAEFGSNTGGKETTVFSATVKYSDETVKTQVDDAEDAKGKLTLLGRTLPLVGGILGLLLIIAGIVLTAAARRDRSAPAHGYGDSEPVSVRNG